MYWKTIWPNDWRSGLRYGWGNCVVFVGKTLNSHNASLHSTQEYKWVPENCYGNLYKILGSYPFDGLVSHPRGVEILLIASCYGTSRMRPYTRETLLVIAMY